MKFVVSNVPNVRGMVEMIGPEFKPDERFCTYLLITTRPRKGYSEYNCVCQEETCAGCMKDGICPIYPEMKKKIEEISKNYGGDKDGTSEPT
jgi:hypothetical protein